MQTIEELFTIDHDNEILTRNLVVTMNDLKLGKGRDPPKSRRDGYGRH